MEEKLILETLHWGPYSAVMIGKLMTLTYFQELHAQIRD